MHLPCISCVFTDLSYCFPLVIASMMTSSNGNIFRVTGHLCGEFTGHRWIPTQRPVTRSFDVFFHLRLNKRLSKRPWGWWFETLSCPLWRHCNENWCRLIRSQAYRDTSGCLTQWPLRDVRKNYKCISKRLEHFKWNCSSTIATELHLWYVSIDSDNGLMPSANSKPSTEPMLTNIYVAIWRYKASVSSNNVCFPYIPCSLPKP